VQRREQRQVQWQEQVLQALLRQRAQLLQQQRQRLQQQRQRLQQVRQEQQGRSNRSRTGRSSKSSR
jgi:hypothetical protein